jgi:hypothetical protein
MYYLALNNLSEGWSLEKLSLDEIKIRIKTGQTYGSEFKIFKEIDIEIKT